MLSEVTDISQLSANIRAQLRREGDFYISSCFTEDMIGPRIVKIGEKIYYRFMKYVYLPKPPESLDTKQVIELCEVRLKHLGALLTPQLNRDIVGTIADYVRAKFANADSPIKALDFGCGSGLSLQLLLEYMPNLDIVGVDISQQAVFEARSKGFEVFLTSEKELLPFKAETFDCIFAIFVMHFRVDTQTLRCLRELLRVSGKFVFNVYQRDIEELSLQLEDAGFGSIELLPNSKYQISSDHQIISCGILS